MSMDFASSKAAASTARPDVEKKARRARRLRKLWLSTAVLAALLALLELGVRVRYYFKHGTFGEIHELVRDERSGLDIPEPLRDTGSIQIDSRGFRNPELEVPKPDGRIRLAFLGASTTFCAEASSNAATWPALVTRALAERHPSRSIDYVNAGIAGYSVVGIQRNFERRVEPLAPDVVVFYEAVNELIRDYRRQSAEPGASLEPPRVDAGLASVSMAWRTIEKNLALVFRRREALAAPPRASYDPEQLLGDYEERLTTLVRRIQQTTPVVVLVTFSQRLRPNMTADEMRAACVTHNYYMPHMRAEDLIRAFAAYNEAIRAVARATGAMLIEGEDEIPADAAHFADSVHFTDLGCQRMSARVLAGLEHSSALRALLQAQ